MEKRNSVSVAGRCVMTVLILAMLPVVSCKKEEKAAEKAPAQGVNPYTNESVFVEVKKQLDENPKDAEAWYHLADLYERNMQYAEAIDAYKKVIELKPDMGYAYLKMGTAYDRINQPEEAVKVLTKATQRMPRFAVAYNNLGVAYGRLGKFNEEIAALQKAVKLRPAYTAARYNLGMTYLKVKNKRAAVREYEALKEYDEGAAEALRKEIDKTA